MKAGKATTRPAVAIAITALTLLATAPSARGATQLGETFSPSGGCSDRDYFQTGAPGAQYTAPFAGVITSWSHHASSPANSVKFKVARPLGGDSFLIIAVSELKFPVPGQLNTYTDIRVPVQPGDVIGGHFFGPGFCSRLSGGYGYHFSFAGDDLGPGTTTTLGSATGSQLDISATLEPDADGDGFGDETQDGCPTDPSKQVDCYPPETQITNGPKDKTKKKQVTFEFGSDDPGATFECSLDGKVFACTSPVIQKVGKGKHSFQVRARDAVGNVDGSPASDSWKVKKKK